MIACTVVEVQVTETEPIAQQPHLCENYVKAEHGLLERALGKAQSAVGTTYAKGFAQAVPHEPAKTTTKCGGRGKPNHPHTCQTISAMGYARSQQASMLS